MLLQNNVHYAFAILFDHFLLDFKEKNNFGRGSFDFDSMDNIHIPPMSGDRKA